MKDLAQDPKEMYGLASSIDDKKPQYPTFHYTGTDSLDLPEDGEMTIKFHVVSETETSKDGKHRYECVVEVRAIEDVAEETDEAPAHGADKSVSDLLDSLMEKHMSEKNGKSEY
jgi:hypothetical protein